MSDIKGATDSRGAAVPEIPSLRGKASVSPAHTFCETELLQLVSLGSDWIWETDEELRFSWLSNEYEAITGIDPKKVLGRFRFDFLKQVSQGSKSAAAHLDDLQARRPFRNFVYELKGGRVDCRWISITGVPRHGADGVFLGYRGIGRNVTGLAASFDELQELGGDLSLAATGGEIGRPSSDLERAFDALKMGVVLLDADLNAQIINKAYRDLSKMEPGEAPVGSPFRALMETIRRHDSIYDIADDKWVSYVEARLAEIRAGDIAPREFTHADGNTMIYSVTALSGGKRLLCYYDITEIKVREAEIAHANAKTEELFSDFRLMIDTMPIGVVVVDPELRVEVVNRAFYDFWDIDPARYGVGSAFCDLMNASRHIDAQGSDDAGWERHVAERDAEIRAGIANTRQLARSDGRTLVGSLTPLSGGRRLLSYVDMTEIKSRERDLRRSMRKIELFRHVLDDLPVAAYVKSADLAFEFVNKAWTEITGISKEQAAGHTDRDFFDGEGEGFAGRDVEVLRTGVTNETEETLTHTDGTQRRLIARKSRLVASDGSVHLIGSSTDITEVKTREVRLQESLRENEIFRSLIDNVPVAIYAKRDDLKLFYVNKYWTQLTGVPCEQAVGKTDVEVSGKNGLAFMESDRAILRTGENQVVEEVLAQADGSMRYQIARKGSMVASDGSLYLLGSTIDVTEQKERERELQEAQRRAVLADRAKSEFLANMSHEIRTPMNGVLGMAELLAKSNLDPKQKTFTEIIVKSGNALLTIINDILDFSKIDAGQLLLDPAPFKLAEAIEDVATLISTRAKEKDLELIVRIQPGLHDMFVGDVGRIRQIITNLIGNAVKFTDSGHVLIDVSGEPAGDGTKIRIAVTDTGIGIPAEKLGVVFEKFSQVDASSTRRHEGTGLGLAITSRLVALMGGEIGVDSIEGRGSTFWFTVALPNAGQSKRQLVTPFDVTGARILVVDDNPVNRAILTEQMAAWTFDACAAESGEEGLKVLMAAAACGLAVDCIVLDYQMPGMSGGEMARLLRATENIAATPIVMLTSVDQSLSNSSYRDLSIDAQLIKPARSSVLLETLVSTIQKHRSLRAGPVIVDVTAPGGERLEAGTPAATPASRRRRKSTADQDHRIDILVAEDNEVNQLVFTQILGETDYSFEVVANGRLALKAFVEMNPRMILMDVSMPEMNGLEAAGAIRGAEAGTNHHVPIIGVTAHALKGDRERCLDAGMDDYLPKPISPKALIEKVERWAWRGEHESRDAG